MSANALLFSGQGSQYVGMAKDLAAEFSQVRSLFEKADEIMEMSLSAICFEGPEERLKETRYTQPALFVHEAAIVNLIGDRLQYAAVAGHSLGEYSALYAAGVLDFEAALKLVKLRGELMFRSGERAPGAMAAIIGLDNEAVQAVCAEIGSPEHPIVPANYNSPGQVVVSGSAEALQNNLDAFKDAGARKVMALPVSGAFHSPLMADAQEELAVAIHSAAFADAAVDVYCNASAESSRSAETLREQLIRQLVAPVLWTQTLANMQANGLEHFYELGPGKVLQGLVKRTLGIPAAGGYDTAVQITEFLDASIV